AKWPAAGEILANMTLSVDDQQPMMGKVDVDGQSVDETVDAWMQANPDKWKPVVDAAIR
ncbi:MAG: glycine betaine ABC transporter substrate-binding protein, partial [Rhodobacterales bacterium]|nr:glycine betaine ABC transporter substrate-binding protein [Rhodobacterales bacterium]